MKLSNWTIQNIFLLSVAVVSIPAIGGVTLYLLSKPNDADQAEVKSTTSLATVTPLPAKMEPVSEQPEPKPEPTKAPAARRDRESVNNLIGRIESATTDGVLAEEKKRIRTAIKVADFVEPLHTVHFEAGKDSLENEDVIELLSDIRDNELFQRQLLNPNATLVVLGYDSKNGDPGNNELALTRAKNTGKKIRDNDTTLRFAGPVKTWTVGETDLFSLRENATDSESDRAAEVWLVIDNDRLLQQVPSDEIAMVTPAAEEVAAEEAAAEEATAEEATAEEAAAEEATAEEATAEEAWRASRLRTLSDKALRRYQKRGFPQHFPW